MTSPESLACHGYRMPAEWEPQHGVWLAWPPENSDDFAGVHRAPVLQMYAGLIDELLGEGHVYLNNGPQARRCDKVRILEAEQGGRLHLLDIPSSEWCRDFGPTFVVGERDSLAAVDWNFSVWGGKYGEPFAQDRAATRRMAGYFGVPLFAPQGLQLEGGAIDVNGSGTLLTTDSCLLNPNRGNVSNRAALEGQLKAFLGIEKIIWLSGVLSGDDTDGHIDTLARFVSPTTVVAVEPSGAGAESDRALRENIVLLGTETTAKGERLEVIPLPQPSPVWIAGTRMPASYANFLIANNAVFVPQFDVPEDRGVMTLLQECFPGKRLVAVDCSDLIWGRGAIHCIAQPIPYFNR